MILTTAESSGDLPGSRAEVLAEVVVATGLPVGLEMEDGNLHQPCSQKNPGAIRSSVQVGRGDKGDRVWRRSRGLAGLCHPWMHAAPTKTFTLRRRTVVQDKAGQGNGHWHEPFVRGLHDGSSRMQTSQAPADPAGFLNLPWSQACHPNVPSFGTPK